MRIEPAPELSLCVPTRNREAQLGVCLESLLRGMEGLAPGRVEIVISDNASTDGTEAYCRGMAARHGAIRYHRNAENLGGGNFVKAVERASGNHCWLFGDDDALPEGVLVRVLAELGSGHDVYLGPRVVCDRDLVPAGTQHWHVPGTEGDWDLATDPERIRYFNACSTLGGVFAFISAQIFRREAWNAVALPEGPGTGLHYPHVYRLLAFARRLRILDFPVVLGRVLDLHEEEGNFQSTVQDLDSMLQVARALGYRRNGRLWDAFFGVLRRNHCGDHYPRMVRLQAPDQATWEAFRPKLQQIGYSVPFLDALDRAHAKVPRGVRSRLALPGDADQAVKYSFEHMAFLLHGVRCLAVVGLGPPEEARGLEELLRGLKRDFPAARILWLGRPDMAGLRGHLGEGDRFLDVDPDSLEGDAAARAEITRLGAEMEAGLVLNASWPRTRASDIASALIPCFSRIGLPGTDPRVDPLYTAVLPRDVLGEGHSRAMGLALGVGVRRARPRTGS